MSSRATAERPLPRYDIRQTYRWNYDHAPDPVEVEIPPLPGRWTFCGRPVESPLGMPAGPLLNGRWVLYYAGLGFDVLTYKTVRSRARECYALPNLQPVRTPPLSASGRSVVAADAMDRDWAVSFGMPSMAPNVWRADVERTRRRLPAGKLLVVSVVGTVDPGATLEELAEEYARCARWAVESGADAVESNFSCPNVLSVDGQLYEQRDAAAVVARRVRDAIGDAPHIIKIGHMTDAGLAADLVRAVVPHASALAMTNTIPATVRTPGGEPLFGGLRRGIAGPAILDASAEQVRLFARAIRDGGHSLSLIGVGGAGTADDVRRYLDAGAEAVQIATAAMLDPLVACRIRSGMAAATTRG